MHGNGERSSTWNPELPEELLQSSLYRRGGYAVVSGLIEAQAFENLIAEAKAARHGATRGVAAESDDAIEDRGGSPARAFATGPGGELLWSLYGSPQMAETLAVICGIEVKATGCGSYSYYERDGDFLSLHRDIVTCDVAVITCLTATGPSAGELLAYPSHIHAPLSHARAAGRLAAVPVQLRPGDTVALFGGILPHEVTPMGPAQERIVSVMCYRTINSPIDRVSAG